MNASFWGLLQEITHNAYMAGTYFLAGLTIFILALACNRLRPKRTRERRRAAAARPGGQHHGNRP